MAYKYEAWEGFEAGTWTREINVRSFIRHNFTPYDGNEEFLAGPTQNTLDLWEQVSKLTLEEREHGGVLDMDTEIISTITSHGPGYLNKDKEQIVGLQTDKPFKRALMPYGGIRMAEKACSDNGYKVDPKISEFFTIHRKTHNAGVFDVYTPEMRACRSSHIITGLPDAYGRGRIIGDYRRVALYGVERLIEDKMEQKETTRSAMYSKVIRQREELSEQIRALQDLAKMAASYGYDIMRPVYGDDYGIACCVSAMRIGKQMQFFGARANLAKCLLYAINGGIDEVSKKQVGPKYRPITSEYLDFDEVMERFDAMMEWLCRVYVNTLNVIHYMHDKYCYEKIQMALHDKKVTRWFATGIAGLSVVADSLSAIKYAKVKVIRDETGLAVDYEVEGDFPKYGNDDDRVDELANMVLHHFMEHIRKNHTYRESIPTTSILTITSNVVYGKATGSTPDGRKKGEAFAPGANPMHRRDEKGAIASLSSVAKLSFKDAQDGISNTFSIIPGALGKGDDLFMGDFGDLGMELSDLGLNPDELECNTCANVPTLFEGLDGE